MKESGRRYELSSIELMHAKLDEYAYAMKTVEGDSLSEIEIREFFYGGEHSCIKGGNQSIYQHNKLQWVMSSYFEEMGFKQVRAVSYGYLDVMPPKKQDIENEPGKYFQAYEDAVVYYERSRGKKSKEKDRIVVEVDENFHGNGMNYTIYHNLESSSLFTDWSKLADEKNFYKGKKINVSGEFLKLNDVGWDDVVLSEEKKGLIRESVAELFENSEVFRKFGISIQRGVILHGRPGTGKTQICRALAKESKCSVLYALPTDFQKNQAGVRRVTDMAKDLAPCVLIIEDMDWIALDRDAGRAGFVMELMNQMDGIEAFGDIVTVGTTNRKEDLEEAVKNRPGRFDRLIEVDYPALAERVAMVQSFCSQWDISQVNIEKIAENLKDLSGAHIKEICKTAAIHAVYAKSFADKGEKLVVTNDHFLKAWEEVKDKDISSFLETQAKSGGNSGFGFAPSRSSDPWDEL
tara:strand:+ start:12674 stop:14062 length:1389 start_codon:yes stop_codon:yes gene_type:complete